MKAELRHYYLGALGLHTLCARLDLTPGRNELETPPIVQIDAIWLSQLRATGQVRLDAKGRLQAVKATASAACSLPRASGQINGKSIL